ncbi:MAG: lysophospholipid acyltransferase family protein [Pseudomonadales bacterium]|jgi:putative hemolysin|nr:lysophospholipid acyltransferase family protein [Pseudomonadales bacterium]
MARTAPNEALAPAPGGGLDAVHAPYLRDAPTLSYVEPHDPWLRRTVLSLLERSFGRDRLQALYRDLKAAGAPPEQFFRNALEAAGIRIDLRGTPLDALPGSGPLVFIANHPFGITDGLAFCELALRARGDLRILLHAMLCQDRDLARFFLPIDFTETPRAQITNLRSRQLALTALADGVPLLIFPAGGVSTRSHFGFGPLADLPWSTYAAKLITQSGATVVPCHFHGENSRLFHLASPFSQTLRYALLLHETRRRFEHSCTVTIGRPIPAAEIAALSGRRAQTERLHAATWDLGLG